MRPSFRVCVEQLELSWFWVPSASVIRRRGWRGSQKRQAGNPGEIHRPLVPEVFTCEELKRATRDFSESNLLDTGGFGAV